MKINLSKENFSCREIKKTVPKVTRYANENKILTLNFKLWKSIMCKGKESAYLCLYWKNSFPRLSIS